jgi:superfamily I DNA/RNA helicase
MRTWLVARGELLPDQLRAIELAPTEHRVIAGPPGSGKTQVLLHRAAFLRERLGTEPNRFRIFVFTNSLKSYIRSALHLLDLPPGCVWGFDAWCVGFYRRRISPVLPTQDDEDATPDFAGIRTTVATWLREHPPSPKFYDFAMVDEGQDLDGAAFAILTAIAGHVTVGMDVKQQIYDGGSDEAEVLRGLGLRRRNVALLEAFRCCPYIAELASQFVEDPQERAAYLAQVRTTQTEREQSLVVVAPSAGIEMAMLADALRARLARSERVGVLVPKRRVMAEVAAAMRAAGIAVETSDRMDFASDLPKVMPYHSAKGITLDSVLLPGLQTENFRRYTPRRIERLLFVAITRAQGWAYLSTVVEGKTVFAPLERLVTRPTGHNWAVQDWRKIPPVYDGAAPAAPPPDDNLTSLL